MRTRIIYVDRWRLYGLLEASGLSEKTTATFDRYGNCTHINWEEDIYTQSTDKCKRWDVRDAIEVIRYLNQLGSDRPESRIHFAC